jgi:hypothetical protein
MLLRCEIYTDAAPYQLWPGSLETDGTHLFHDTLLPLSLKEGTHREGKPEATWDIFSTEMRQNRNRKIKTQYNKKF